ncbi:hypothetical protein SAMN04488543_3033 [Friedmanniella luteola]|uniref:CdiI immunity protein domain-containing protein n=1 Tax=Friedmanniella luteola TaxID=546871 RepID=A0A1H1XLF3_9ACTN|nr:hypothetical protein [Friedmanniella luteola]SDT10050.1 hypothetical protein SAMN04488543_3033 [Friedmanniella luteola]
MAEPAGAPAPSPERYTLFEAAWQRTACPLSQLWVEYLGLGGTVDLFSLDAFLHGVMPLAPVQQDVLANAINEQLDDLYRAAKVPYLHTLHASPVGRDPLTVLDELFDRWSHGSADPA